MRCAIGAHSLVCEGREGFAGGAATLRGRRSRTSLSMRRLIPLAVVNERWCQWPQCNGTVAEYSSICRRGDMVYNVITAVKRWGNPRFFVLALEHSGNVHRQAQGTSESGAAYMHTSYRSSLVHLVWQASLCCEPSLVPNFVTKA